jgi:hypothetical protein
MAMQGSWDHFKLVQQGVGQNPGMPLFYNDGCIEILRPGREHEVFAHIIDCLISIFLARHRTDRGLCFAGWSIGTIAGM